MPYQIIRQPVRSSSPPFQLPEGAVIDMDGSGEDTERFADNSDPVVITFAPGGALDKIYHVELGEDTQVGHRITGPIHLLIGRRENVRDPLLRNWLDADTIWVSIGTQTGRITSSQNDAARAAAQNGDEDISDEEIANAQIFEARRFAREMHGLIGK